MLTGYNTDVACDGVTYHVQTEDKGLANPIILSLVYQGGTILAAKRTSYGEMVSEGAVDEKNLAAMLERQHQILIAAIRAGKIEQLIKRSAEAASSAQLPTETEQPVPNSTGSGSDRLSASNSNRSDRLPAPKPEAPPSMTGDTAPTELLSSKPIRRSTGPLVDFNLDQIIAGYLPADEARERLSIELMTSPHFVAGEQVKVCAAVLFENKRPADNATVKMQIVGTSIKPQNFVSLTDQNGIVNFSVTLPSFTAGTAALILRAAAPKGQEAELKFLIRRK